jgi:guanylate kinase
VKKNKIIAIIGPSGSGKTDLAGFLMKEFGFRYIPSVTTRPKRESETFNYNHYSLEEFQHFIDSGEIFEYTTFDNHFYGKLTQDIERHLNEGSSLYTITTDRVDKLKDSYPETVVICLDFESPAEENLRKRLLGRGHEEEKIQDRLKTLKEDQIAIDDLKKVGLIDLHIVTKEGDKEHTYLKVRNYFRKQN